MRAYGYKRDLGDKRDHRYAVQPPGIALPDALNLTERPTMPPEVDDQGPLGSCTGNGGGLAACYAFRKAGIIFKPSRLFPYYVARLLEGTAGIDAGAYIRDVAKAFAQYGSPDERSWPYIIDRFALRPPKSVFKEALQHRVVGYARVPQTADGIRQALFANHLVVFGFSVYESFESEYVAKSGVVPMPNFETESMLGGHCMVIVGYDHPKRRFLVRNSWGITWGLGGYCWMPYDYVLDQELAADFWVFTQVQ